MSADYAAMAHFQWEGLTTWYEIYGEPGGRLPVVLCHGGPGATHDYLLCLRALDRQVVFYDQVGNGRSQHLRDAPAEFWTVELFKRELDALVAHLGWAGGYHVLGQSWGGMLAMEHALEHPTGLRSLVVADSPASMRLWVEEANRLRADLPADARDALTRHEAAGTTDSPEYQEAMNVFYRRHVCRLDPWPEEVVRAFARIEEDPTVYFTMNGPSEFHVIGVIRDWDITARLGEIDVPVLLASGRHDEATPRIVGEIHERIPGSEWVVFEESSHMPHVEEAERFRETVEAFLARVETA
jgi:L-proline amide hydrolase